MAARPTAEQSDEALVRLTLEHGSQYFGNLVKRHSDYLFGLGMRLSGGNNAMAEDMAQQTAIKAFKYLSGFNSQHSGLGVDPSKRFRNWLTGIAVNCYSDLAKSEAKYVSMGDSELHAISSPLHTNHANSAHQFDEFQAMIKPLNTQERQLVTLRFVYEYNIDEIAGMLNLNSGTVKSKLSRAVTRLRDDKKNSTVARGKE